MAGAELDTTGRRLLELLTADGRRPVASLARALNLSRTAVQDRIARLERDGWIEGYTVLTKRPLDEGGHHALLFITIDVRPCAPVLRAVRGVEEVERVWSLSGAIDAIAEAHTQDAAALSQLTDRVAAIRGVGTVRSQTVLSST